MNTAVYPESASSIGGSPSAVIAGSLATITGFPSIATPGAGVNLPAAVPSPDYMLPNGNGAPELRTPLRGGLAPWQQRKIIEHVEENFASSIRINDLAALAKLRPSHFSRAFKATFNDSPYNYILGRRLALAAQMMMQTDEPLSFIALECGMADQPHFCNLFRKFYGVTPRAWRQRQRSIIVVSHMQ